MFYRFRLAECLNLCAECDVALSHCGQMNDIRSNVAKEALDCAANIATVAHPVIFGPHAAAALQSAFGTVASASRFISTGGARVGQAVAERYYLRADCWRLVLAQSAQKHKMLRRRAAEWLLQMVMVCPGDVLAVGVCSCAARDCRQTWGRRRSSSRPNCRSPCRCL